MIIFCTVLSSVSVFELNFVRIMIHLLSMYESLHISDETLKQIVGNYQKIVKLSKSEVAHILDHDIENEDLTETVREKVKSLIAICQLSDRLRRYASYPHVIDPDRNLYDWFRSPSVLLDGIAPLEFLRSARETSIYRLRDILIEFFR